MKLRDIKDAIDYIVGKVGLDDWTDVTRIEITPLYLVVETLTRDSSGSVIHVDGTPTITKYKVDNV